MWCFLYIASNTQIGIVIAVCLVVLLFALGIICGMIVARCLTSLVRGLVESMFLFHYFYAIFNNFLQENAQQFWLLFYFRFCLDLVLVCCSMFVVATEVRICCYFTCIVRTSRVLPNDLTECLSMYLFNEGGKFTPRVSGKLT